jgi:hypothetical protein
MYLCINTNNAYLRLLNALYAVSSKPFLKYPTTRTGAVLVLPLLVLERISSACLIEVTSVEPPCLTLFTHSTSFSSLNSSLNSETASPSSTHLNVGKPSMLKRSPRSFSVSASTLATRMERSISVMVLAASAKSARNAWRVEKEGEKGKKRTAVRMADKL